MKLEVFTEVINRLRKQSDKQDVLYELDIDLINYSDDYTSIINILFDQATTNDGKPICYDIKSLWEEVEQCRLDNKDEYELPIGLTDEEKLEFLKIISKGM